MYYNQVTFQQCGVAGYLAVPSVPRRYGYVMDSCYIKSETPDVTYYLGRPWGRGTPTAIWLNTKVDTAPIEKDNRGINGWADMSGGWPDRFAEYNTHLTDGTAIDASGRRALFIDKEGNEHLNSPVLSASEAELYTIDRVLEGWNPKLQTCPATKPAVVILKGKKLTWKDSPDALLYVISCNGKVVAFTTSCSYKLLKGSKKSDLWTVRAANQMGGLGTPIPAIK